MKNQLTIGSIIHDIVLGQKMSIADFAKKINCSRSYADKITKKDNLDIQLLSRISKALNHNFFEDLAKNYDIANPSNDTHENNVEQKAVSQFLEIVPQILGNMGLDNQIFFGRPSVVDENFPFPDYYLPSLFIDFTIGESLEQRASGRFDNILNFNSYKNEKGQTIIISTNKFNNIQHANIVIDYKTEEEWREALAFAHKIIKKVYNSTTIEKIKHLNQ